ncbi:hypothetical protein CSUI_009357 [Cystoisospora suis]|uniref:Transmembrane protein n=1 Tax=Cystoisospora suis TaxID=483139 RepID=A0A2C6KK92_9APIC|nr:hypothetical protein CSUI_009357 [Cystoisospora suis]
MLRHRLGTVARMDGPRVARRQTGAAEWSSTNLRGILSAFVYAVEDEPPILGSGDVPDFRARRRKRGSRVAGRYSAVGAGLRTLEVVMAVGILLVALVTSRFVRCLDASSLHRFPPRRMISGGTLRRLANDKEVELRFLPGEGGGYETKSFAGSLDDCLREVLVVHSSAQDDPQPNGALPEKKGAPLPWHKSALGLFLFSVPVLLGLTSLILSVISMLLPDEASFPITAVEERNVLPASGVTATVSGGEYGDLTNNSLTPERDRSASPTTKGTATLLQSRKTRVGETPSTATGVVVSNAPSASGVATTVFGEGNGNELTTRPTTGDTETPSLKSGLETANSASRISDVTSVPSLVTEHGGGSASLMTTVTPALRGVTQLQSTVTPGGGANVSATKGVTGAVSGNGGQDESSVSSAPTHDGERGASSVTSVTTTVSGSQTTRATRVVSATKEEDVSTASGVTSTVSARGAQNELSGAPTPTDDGRGGTSSATIVTTMLPGSGTTGTTGVVSATTQEDLSPTTGAAARTSGNEAQDSPSALSAQTEVGEGSRSPTAQARVTVSGSTAAGATQVPPTTKNEKAVSPTSGVATTVRRSGAQNVTSVRSAVTEDWGGSASSTTPVTTVVSENEAPEVMKTQSTTGLDGANVSLTFEITEKEKEHVVNTLSTSTATAANVPVTPGVTTTVSGDAHRNVASVSRITEKGGKAGAPSATTATTMVSGSRSTGPEGRSAAAGGKDLLAMRGSTAAFLGEGTQGLRSVTSTPEENGVGSASSTAGVTVGVSENGTSKATTIPSTATRLDVITAAATSEVTTAASAKGAQGEASVSSVPTDDEVRAPPTTTTLREKVTTEVTQTPSTATAAGGSNVSAAWQVTGGVSGSGSWDVTSFPSTPAQGVEESASSTTTVTTTVSERGVREVATIPSAPGWYGTDVSLTSTTGVSRDQYPSVTSVPPTTDKAGEAGAASTTVTTVDSGSGTAGTTRVVSATKEEDVSTASGATSRISGQGAQRGTNPGATPTGDGAGSASSMSRVTTTLGWNGTTKPTTIASTATRVDGATAAATSKVKSSFFGNGAQNESSGAPTPTDDGKGATSSATIVTTMLPGSGTTGTTGVVSATTQEDLSPTTGAAARTSGNEAQDSPSALSAQTEVGEGSRSPTAQARVTVSGSTAAGATQVPPTTKNEKAVSPTSGVATTVRRSGAQNVTSVRSAVTEDWGGSASSTTPVTTVVSENGAMEVAETLPAPTGVDGGEAGGALTSRATTAVSRIGCKNATSVPPEEGGEGGASSTTTVTAMVSRGERPGTTAVLSATSNGEDVPAESESTTAASGKRPQNETSVQPTLGERGAGSASSTAGVTNVRKSGPTEEMQIPSTTAVDATDESVTSGMATGFPKTAIEGELSARRALWTPPDEYGLSPNLMLQVVKKLLGQLKPEEMPSVKQIISMVAYVLGALGTVSTGFLGAWTIWNVVVSRQMTRGRMVLYGLGAFLLVLRFSLATTAYNLGRPFYLAIPLLVLQGLCVLTGAAFVVHEIISYVRYQREQTLEIKHILEDIKDPREKEALTEGLL